MFSRSQKGKTKTDRETGCGKTLVKTGSRFKNLVSQKPDLQQSENKGHSPKQRTRNLDTNPNALAQDAETRAKEKGRDD